MRALLAALALLLAAPALAHSGHATLSVVWIDAKGGLSVTHRFTAHDVEPALVSIAPDAQPSLDDPQALAAFQAYVARRFVIEGATLTLQSTELAGDDVTLVFSGTMPPSRAVTVRGALFKEAYSDHNTQVNIRMGGITRSLWFMPGDGPKTVRFGP